MLGSDAFDGKDEAHLAYARALPGNEGAAILEERAGRDLGGGAEKHAGLWFAAAQDIAGRIDARRQASLAEAALRAAMAGSVETARPYLDALAYFVEQHAPDRLSVLFKWLESSTDPGDADAVARLLRRWAKQEPSTAAYLGRFAGVAQWLLHNGGGVLRSSEHALILPFVVDIVRHHGEPDEIELALRYIIRNTHGAMAWTPCGPEILWPAIEACLASDRGHGLLVDLLELPGASQMLSTESFFRPLLDPDLLHARSEMLRALDDGHFAAHRQTQGWKLAMQAGLPGPSHLARIEAFLGGAEALRTFTEDQRSSARTWAAWLARGAFRLLGLHEAAETMASALLRNDATPARLSAIHAGLRDALEGALEAAPDDDGLRLARAILRDSPEPSAAIAALKSLPGMYERAQILPTISEGTVGAELARIVHRPWDRSRSGVDMARLLADIHQVEFENLDSEDKVRLKPPQLLVARGPLARFLSADPDPDRCMRCALLYVLHELIHLAQGIGHKDTVLQMKRAGEYALLHMDLSADHAAAVVLAEAVPRYRLLALKDLAGRMLERFPVGLFHASTAAERKAVRLVSVRADYLARREGWVDDRALRDSYLFVDYPPGEGTLALMANTNPVSVVKAVELSAPDAIALSNAARPPIDIDATDRLILRLFAAAPKT